MREYLFRGKRIDNGEWVEGYLVYNKARKQYYIMDDVNAFPIPVDKESVGQLTGLTDKNGKKIFEDDIVKTQAYSDHPYSAKRKDKRFLGVVEYYEDKWRDENSKFKNHIYDNGFRVKIVEDMGKYTHGSWSAFWDCEVIGNIHDNPELLEVE